MRRQPSLFDDDLFRYVVIFLLFGIFWVTVTDYHFEMPEKQEHQPMTAQDKALIVWTFYIMGMIGAWAIFLVVYWDGIRDSLRDFWKRHKEKKQARKEAS